MKKPNILKYLDNENLIDEVEFEEALEEYEKQCEYCRDDE